MNPNTLKICGALVLLAWLPGCSEPQPAPGSAVDVAPATPQQQAQSDAAFASEAPQELAHAERQLPLVPSSDCNLERANGAVFTGAPVEVSGSEPLRLSGWVANREEQSVPVEAKLRLINAGDNRAWQIPVSSGLARGDVQELLGGNPAFASAGFSVTMDVSKLPAGRYRIYTVLPASAGLRVCDNGRAVTIN